MGPAALLGEQLLHRHQVVAEPGRGQGLGPLAPALEPAPLLLQLGGIALAQPGLQEHQPVASPPGPEQQAHHNGDHAADGRVQGAVEHVIPVQGHMAGDHQEHQADQRRGPGGRLPAQPAQQGQDQQQRHQHPRPAGQHGVDQEGDQPSGDGAENPHPGGLEAEVVAVLHDRDHGQHRVPDIGDPLEPERQGGGEEGGHPEPQAVAKQGGPHGPRGAGLAGAYGGPWSMAVGRCAMVEHPSPCRGQPWSSR